MDVIEIDVKLWINNIKAQKNDKNWLWGSFTAKDSKYLIESAKIEIHKNSKTDKLNLQYCDTNITDKRILALNWWKSIINTQMFVKNKSDTGRKPSLFPEYAIR